MLLAHPPDGLLDVPVRGGEREVRYHHVLRQPLAVLGVEAPPAADGTVAVHEQVEPASLQLVEVRHPRPAGTELLADLRRGGAERRRVQHLGVEAGPTADLGQVALDPVVDRLVPGDLLRTKALEQVDQLRDRVHVLAREHGLDPEPLVAQPFCEREERGATHHERVGVEAVLLHEQVVLDQDEAGAVGGAQVLLEQLVRQDEPDAAC